MEDKRTINYNTTIDLEKIPRRKLNFKQMLYKQRIRYGNYINMGLVSDKLKFKIKDGKIIYLLDNNNNNKINKAEQELLLKDDFYKSLFYSSDLDFNIMPSKREIKLRQMLKDKINRLNQLINNSEELKEGNGDEGLNNKK